MRPALQPLLAVPVSLTLFAITALHADVTLRYQTEVTVNPALPAQMTQGMSEAFSKSSTVQFKNTKGYSLSGGTASIYDFDKKEMTLLDPDGKRCATLPYQPFSEEFARAMPELPDAAKAGMAGMKTQFESRLTGRTAIIQGVEGEEHELNIAIEGPAMPNAPAGPMIRMIVRFWTAKATEIMRVPAIREIAGYNLFAAATMNPISSLEQALRRMPGFGDNFAAFYKEMQSGGTPVILRMQLEMFMPMMGALMKNMPPGYSPFGAGFDPNAPLLQTRQELTELSTAPIPDSVFQVPDGYQSAPAAELIQQMIVKSRRAVQ